ncbi:MAG: recombinase family protein [Candidatus Dormibacteria bacterium]
MAGGRRDGHRSTPVGSPVRPGNGATPVPTSASGSRAPRIALYARCSTRDKDQDPEVQLVPLREHAAARGWEVTEYVDHAAAADMAGRTAWARLVEDARRRRIDLVLVRKLDRAFRSTLHCLRTLERWEHERVGFACLTQPIDTTSPTDRLLLTVLAALAEFERGLIAERVKEGMANARRKGVRIGRPRAAERAAVAPQLPAVRAEVAAGIISKRAAARKLNIGVATLGRLLAAPKREAG